MTEIEQELLELQVKLKAPKDQKNNFGNYKYRKAEDILEAVKQVTTRPITLEDELVLIGNRYYIKATASFGIGLDSVTCSAYARECETKKGMDESQITGAASTYARKYALCGLFAIDDSQEDPDSKENKTEPVKEEKGDKLLFQNWLELIQDATEIDFVNDLALKIKENKTLSTAEKNKLREAFTKTITRLKGEK